MGGIITMIMGVLVTAVGLHTTNSISISISMNSMVSIIIGFVIILIGVVMMSRGLKILLFSYQR